MNGIVVIDKPPGLTSHDVVNRVRRILDQRSVGHLGTLDPSATGVLPIVIGNLTRLAQFYAHAEKTYEGVIRFGFIEIPDLHEALESIKSLDAAVDLEHAVYFCTRDLVVRKGGSLILRHGRLQLFAFLYRNAVKVVDRFQLPAPNVVEIARMIEI